jgi:hypothetical protein
VWTPPADLLEEEEKEEPKDLSKTGKGDSKGEKKGGKDKGEKGEKKKKEKPRPTAPMPPPAPASFPGLPLIPPALAATLLELNEEDAKRVTPRRAAGAFEGDLLARSAARLPRIKTPEELEAIRVAAEEAALAAKNKKKRR